MMTNPVDRALLHAVDPVSSGLRRVLAKLLEFKQSRDVHDKQAALDLANLWINDMLAMPAHRWYLFCGHNREEVIGDLRNAFFSDDD